MYPANSSIIVERAHQWADKITYFDLRKILRDFELSGIVTSFNPKDRNGRIYCLTNEGLDCYYEHFGFHATNKLIYEGDVESLAKVLRRFLVKTILSVMAVDTETKSFSATDIKKKLRYVHSTSLNLIITTAAQMAKEGFLEMEEIEIKNHFEKQYRLSPLGKAIYQEISRMRHATLKEDP